MDINNSVGDYKMPPCAAAGCSGVQTSGDISSYNYLNPMPQMQSMPQSVAGVSQTAPSQMMGSSMQQTAALPQMPAQQSTMDIFRQSGGGTMAPTGGQQGTTSATMVQTGMPPSVVTPDSLQYLNGFMRTQIGKPVLVTFLVGTNTLTDRTGTLLGVGINYILIRETRTDDILACDFYNIKFIRFYQ